jgi:hypothetical protein
MDVGSGFLACANFNFMLTALLLGGSRWPLWRFLVIAAVADVGVDGISPNLELRIGVCAIPKVRQRFIWICSRNSERICKCCWRMDAMH